MTPFIDASPLLEMQECRRCWSLRGSGRGVYTVPVLDACFAREIVLDEKQCELPGTVFRRFAVFFYSGTVPSTIFFVRRAAQLAWGQAAWPGT